DLPHFAEHFSAHAFAARLAAGHHALGGRHDGNAEAALDALDLIAADIDAAAGTRDARQVADGRLCAAVLQVHAQNLPALFFLGLVIRDVALFLENAGNLGLQLRSGNIQLLMAGPDRIPNTRQKICYWVGQTHSLSFIPRSPARREPAGMFTTVVSSQFSVLSKCLLASIINGPTSRTDN